MAQSVDPFIPVQRPRASTQPPSRRLIAPPRQHIRTRPIVRSNATRPQPSRQAYQQPRKVAHLPAPPTTHPATPPIQTGVPENRRRQRWLYPLQLLAACTAIILAGTLLQIAYVGEIMIGLYGAWALLRRLSSRTSFILALVSFATILIMLIARPDPLLMKNFATYAFLFLLIGTISLLREAHD